MGNVMTFSNKTSAMTYKIAQDEGGAISTSAFINGERVDDVPRVGKIYVRFNQKGEPATCYIQADDESGAKKTFAGDLPLVGGHDGADMAFIAEHNATVSSRRAASAKPQAETVEHKPQDYVGEVAGNLCGAMATWTMLYNAREHGDDELASMRKAIEEATRKMERYAEKVEEAKAIPHDEFIEMGDVALDEQLKYEKREAERAEAARKRDKAIAALVAYMGITKEAAAAIVDKREAEAVTGAEA